MTTWKLRMTPKKVQDVVKKLGGVSNAANKLNCSRSTVYRWMKRGVGT